MATEIVDENDIKQLHFIFGPTNAPEIDSIEFNIDMLELPIEIKSVIQTKIPFCTDAFEFDYKKLSSLPIGKMYKFLFSKREFKRKIIEYSVKSSTLTKFEKLDNNIFIILRLLFNPYPNKGKIETSYSILGGDKPGGHFSENKVTSAFGYLTDAVKDTFSNRPYSYLLINGKTYTLRRLIWLNDFLNNPKMKKLIYEYKKFKRWANKIDTTGVEFFKKQIIWDEKSLELKDMDEKNPTTQLILESKRFLEKYPPFEEFFYKIVKTFPPVIVNEKIRKILLSTQTTILINFFESIDNSSSIIQLEEELKKQEEILKKTSSTEFEESSADSANKMTLKMPITIIDGKITVSISPTLILGKLGDKKDDKPSNSDGCNYRAMNILKNVRELKMPVKSNYWEIENATEIYSATDGKFIKFEPKDKDKDIGDYPVIKYLKPKKAEPLFEMLNKPEILSKLTPKLENIQDELKSFDKYISSYGIELEKDRKKKPGDLTKSEIKEFLKKKQDELQNQKQLIKQFESTNPKMPFDKDFSIFSNPPLKPNSFDSNEYRRDIVDFVIFLKKFEFKYNQREILENIGRLNDYRKKYDAKIELLNKEIEKNQNDIRDILGKSTMKGVDRYSAILTRQTVIINLRLTILKCEFIVNLLNNITEHEQKKISVLGGKPKTRRFRKMRRKYKTRKYFI